MDATREYIERHGKPVALYSDKHSVFRNPVASASGDGMTHFGRALEALNIEIIYANSPQEDRLVKAMRLEGVSTIAEANAFLPGYMARHNQRFAKTPFDPRDLHRPLAPHDDLRAEMVWREQRKVTAALTLHYNKALFILAPTEISRPLSGKRVDVCEYPDGRLEIRHGEHSLPYEMFDKIRQVNQAGIVDNKHLDAALAMAKLIQEQLPARSAITTSLHGYRNATAFFLVRHRRRRSADVLPSIKWRALLSDRWRTACAGHVAHADISYDEDTLQRLWRIDSAYDRRKHRRSLHGMQARHTERHGGVARLLSGFERV